MKPQPINVNDYRDFMQAAARSYLERRKDQYLSGDDHLFNACVSHLTNALEVPVFLSQSLVQRAWNDLFPQPNPQLEVVWIGWDWGLGDADRLIDERPKHP
ncbi:hypothetical protein QO209_19630 [Pseudomonas citronellolis]|uniref:hypothetical protein n=1 Tax=Pseudomonas citronellolis TaxID=53408 RepID=UPI0026472356|nr:hypothetical protein [Pseudomonas citronellolis]MDN6874657.1 hypothetical protein [Pseudomonas citronellolis]